MSAWAQLVHWDGSDEFLELCNAALLEVQRETSHRNAEKIRDAPFEDHLLQKHQRARAANLIDPEDTP